jgi:hypothetical protein
MQQEFSSDEFGRDERFLVCAIGFGCLEWKKKPASMHKLRHSFATHLLEDGVKIQGKSVSVLNGNTIQIKRQTNKNPIKLESYKSNAPGLRPRCLPLLQNKQHENAVCIWGQCSSPNAPPPNKTYKQTLIFLAPKASRNGYDPNQTKPQVHILKPTLKVHLYLNMSKIS